MFGSPEQGMVAIGDSRDRKTATLLSRQRRRDERIMSPLSCPRSAPENTSTLE